MGAGPFLAVLTAAGASSRMGLGPKKEYRRLADETVLSRALRALADSALFTAIAITHPEGGEAEARAAISPDLLSAPGLGVVFAPGGKTRRESVLRGLEALRDHGAGDQADSAASRRVVLIHDAARPWASPSLFRNVAETAALHGAAIPLVDTVDTLKLIDNEGFIASQLPRGRAMAAQTPQGFRFPEILEAHSLIQARIVSGETVDSFTDDAEIWAAAGLGRIAWVPGEASNRKITYAEDLG